MRGDREARWPALSSSPPPPLLLLLLVLSRAAALHPGELFPYGQSRGDQLLQEGDDESSAAVKLASPLRFYEAQFSYLYVSSAAAGCEGSADFSQLLPRRSVALTKPLSSDGSK